MHNDLAIPSPKEPNLAPAEPIEQYLETGGQPAKPFGEWFTTLAKRLERQNAAEWDELHLVWEQIDKFIEGKQILRRRHRGLGWDVIPLPNSTASMIREQNKLGFYSHVLMSKWVASRTKVSAIPGDDTDESMGAARAAQAFLEAMEHQIYTEKFRQSEALAGQVHGTYARYFYYDENEFGGYGYKPITEKQPFQAGEDLATCTDCGYAGVVSEFGSVGAAEPEYDGMAGVESPDAMGQDAEVGMGRPDEGMGGAACPACGSPNIQVEPAPVEEIETVTGVEQYKLGNLKGMSVPYSQLRHEISCSFETSPWGRWKRRMRMETLKAAFPGLKIPPPDSSGRDTGLDYEESMRRAVATNAGSTGSKDKDYADFSQWWLAPEMYANYVFPVDVLTVAGETIPAGTKAADMFPDGMYIACIDGIDTPLQVRNECHKKHWVTAPYHIRLFTGLGIGINDAVEMQRQWNVILSLIFQQIRTASLPGWLYDKDALSPDDVRLLGQPQNNVPVSLRNRPEGTRIEQLVAQMPPGQIPAHIPWYVGQLDSNMQTSMGALVNEGVPGMDSKTATGAQLMASASAQHNSPEFALKGDADVRSAYLLLDLAKKYFVEPRYLPLTGKRGKQDGVWLSAADIANGQVRFEAVKDSWLPNTRLDKQESIQKLLLMFGGIQGLMIAQQAMPDFVADIAEAFNVDIVGDIFEPTSLLCRQRVDQIMQIAPQYGQIAAQAQMMQEQAAMMGMPMVDPMSGMPIDPLAQIADEIVNNITPPVIPEEPGHMLSIKWLRDWFLDDEGKMADPMTRACVQALIRKHLEASVLEQQVMSMMSMIANPQPEGGGGEDGQPGPQMSNKAPQRTKGDQRTDQMRANMGGNAPADATNSSTKNSGQSTGKAPRPKPERVPQG